MIRNCINSFGYNFESLKLCNNDLSYWLKQCKLNIKSMVFDMKTYRYKIIYNTIHQQEKLNTKNMYIDIGNTKLKNSRTFYRSIRIINCLNNVDYIFKELY